MKTIIKNFFRGVGLEISSIKQRSKTGVEAGSIGRPIGQIRYFLEDIRARGFIPRGIIDVGANCGDWTRMALAVFPGTRVILIEPQQEMKPMLHRLLKEQSQQKLEIIPAGAGRQMGELVQTIWEDLAGSSFLPEANDEKLRKGTQRVTPIVTIDSLLSNRPDFSPDLVKLDIQGFEIEALMGGTSLFGRSEVFVLETSLYEFMPKMPMTADVIGFMADNGYDLYDITEFLRRPSDGALGQVDLAFARRGGQLRKCHKWFAG